MTAHHIRNLLWGCTTVCVVGAVSVVALVWLLPPGVPNHTVEELSQRASRTTTDMNNQIDAVSFQPLWALDLRRPLYDPPPAVKEEKKFVPPPFVPVLTGTVVAPNQSPASALAIFTTNKGQTALKKIGDEIGGGTIVRINEGSAVVRYYDQELVLTTKPTQAP